MEWVLIIIIYTGHVPAIPVAASTAKFYDKPACENAGKESYTTAGIEWNRIKYICVPSNS